MNNNSNFPVINVYPQQGPHEEATIALSTSGLKQLKEALNSLGSNSSIEVFNSDGEAYTLNIEVSSSIYAEEPFYVEEF
jgi:hypothetical protein